MTKLADLPPLREVIRRHGLSARKELGQHFLLDANLTDRIAHAARRRDEADLSAGTIVEVGPGPGGMTRSLLRLNARVLALEVDPRALAALTELQTAAPERLVIVEVDALTADIQTLAAKHALPPPYRIVSNLPYNIGTLLILQWLHRLDKLEHLVLMFQKEVADRLVSTPGSKSYGRLSILAQWLCVTERLFNVHAASFTPPPKVTSSVVSLRPRRTPLAPARMETLERITAAAFGQRRKMLRQSLKSIVPNPSTLLTAANIDPMSRAEILSVADFCAIARQVSGKADGS